MSDQNSKVTKTAPKKEVETLFKGEKYCVAAVLTDGESDGKLYVAALENDVPGKVELAEPVYSKADYGRAYALCETLAKFMDLRAQAPVLHSEGANSAILEAIQPIPEKN